MAEEKFVLSSDEKAKNELLNKAIAYAVQKHWDGLRKGTDMPYIVHPLEAMQILYGMGADKYLMAAGVLHDTVEDTDASLEDIEEKFGHEIRELVECHTEKDKKLDWKVRKQIALAHLANATKREKMLVLADKLANMRAIARDYEALGEKLWERFKRGKEEQKWYYNEGVKALRDLMEYDDTRERFFEFENLVDDVFGVDYPPIDDGDDDDQPAMEEYEKGKDLAAEGKYPEAVALLEKAMNQGNMLARVYLGCMYASGDGVEEDQAKAFEILLPATAEGYVLADLHVGMDYFLGEGTERNYEKAVEHLECVVDFDEKCEFPQAHYLLGICHKNGYGTSINIKEYLDCMRKAASVDFAPAVAALGAYYLPGEYDEQDFSKSFPYYKKAVELEYVPAYCVYALMLINGDGCEPNVEEGLRLMRIAAEAGESDAQYELGTMHAEGDLLEANYDEAFKWLSLSAEQGNTDSYNYLGVMYEHGYGTEPDMEKAVAYYQEAVDAHDVDAYFNLAVCLLNGNGIKKDRKRAISLFNRAAKHGNLDAMECLAECYEFGLGVKENLVTSYDWYNKAAKEGLPVAMYNVGKCYENGKGTKKNRKRAFDWYQKAAAEGWVPAMNDLGIFYGDGVLGEENPKEAFEWFKKASEDEAYAPALRNLAKCYEEGYGTEANVAEAKRLNELAEKLEKEEK